ncbi:MULTISPECIES: GntR family transcriptional regulator [unclassified Microbacterium]|uniref:GntR family transcriptional regulator n=1 Tax=Microbacterium TaxID=33882 RepID=UPI003B9FA09C
MTTAVERVHAQVRQWLRDGTIEPGAMLSEHELAERFSLSRTPVRSALKKLEADGWLTIYPKRGALVRVLSAEEAKEVSDARQVLETAYVDVLPADVREEFCRRLDGMIAAEEAEHASGSYERLVQLTIDFHRAFVEVGGNSVLLEFYDRLRDRQSIMTLRTEDQVAGRWAEFTAEHRELVEQMRRGDRDGFSAILRHHILRTHGPLMGRL